MWTQNSTQLLKKNLAEHCTKINESLQLCLQTRSTLLINLLSKPKTFSRRSKNHYQRGDANSKELSSGGHKGCLKDGDVH